MINDGLFGLYLAIFLFIDDGYFSDLESIMTVEFLQFMEKYFNVV